MVLRLFFAGSEARLPQAYDLEAIRVIPAGNAYVSFDRELGWVPTPGGDHHDSRARYEHSQAGLRSPREYAANPPPGIKRLSAYGDSFTYCQAVSIGSCWTERLRRALPDTEVLNYGVPGYAADQA
jgi:hypothetical protein